MNNLNRLNEKQIFVGGILVSLIYNLIWIAAYLIVAELYVDQMIMISLVFLMIYLFFAQPLKDGIFKWIVSRSVYGVKWRPDRLERRIQRLHTMKQYTRFFSELMRIWHLPRIRFVLYQPRPRIMFVSIGGQTKWVDFRKKENARLLKYLAENSAVQNVEDFPSALRAYLQRRRIRSIIPLVFRDTVLGFLGMPEKLTPLQLQVADYLGRRFSLFLQNDLLRAHLPRTEAIEKEFSLARRIESLLTHDSDDAVFGDYVISRLKDGWERKYFPAIFMVNESASSGGFFEGFFRRKAGDTTRMFFLLRTARNSHRSGALQLFVVKGYCLALVKDMTGATEMATHLNRVLRDQEGGRIPLEGFIGYTDGKNWEVQYFGEHLRLRQDARWLELPSRDYLGDRRFRMRKPLRIRQPEILEFSIRGHSLIRITPPGGRS